MGRKLHLEHKRFTRLLVIEFSKSINWKRYWKCKCDCGKIVFVTTGELRSGKTKSCGCIRKGINSAENNGMWKGDNVKYEALHIWVSKRIHKPSLCVSCKKCPPYDIANISQRYTRDLSDWEWLCRKCHMTKDGRMKKLLLGLRSQSK